MVRKLLHLDVSVLHSIQGLVDELRKVHQVLSDLVWTVEAHCLDCVIHALDAKLLPAGSLHQHFDVAGHVDFLSATWLDLAETGHDIHEIA